MYIAHTNDVNGIQQTVKAHSEAVAQMCADFAITPLKNISYNIGLLHDIGKYQTSFQRRINGEQITVEHSGCGSQQCLKDDKNNIIGQIMGYSISGHHSGLPDGGSLTDTNDMSTLYGRAKREYEDYSAYKDELIPKKIDRQALIKFLTDDCDNDMAKLIDKVAFVVRYCYSCLTDADTLDTMHFCDSLPKQHLKTNFAECLEKVNKRLSSFVVTTPLQKARSGLHAQAFEIMKNNPSSEVYLLNMPTGSGKTLCSVKLALEQAIRKGKRRIIYVIPFNSIIDQTAQEFEKIFGDSLQLLRHQSTFAYEENSDLDEDYMDAAKKASENWDADFIITTAVQFFESVCSNKKRKLRKLHNLQDSIIIFDEAHLMPVDFLQPCLQSVSYITKYLHTQAIFLTATMPEFDRLFSEYTLNGMKVENLITEKTDFRYFQKCRYVFLKEQSQEQLLERAGEYPSSLLIVNTRKKAQELYKKAGGEKYHLSTYMTAYDRERIIRRIKQRIALLSDEFKQVMEGIRECADVPQERRITVISTSLIEAGVDLDFYTVFRELSGLDNILQAGGRCNREGKRQLADVYIYKAVEDFGKTKKDIRQIVTQGIIDEFSDIDNAKSINCYYERLFKLKHDDIVSHTLSKDNKSVNSIQFAEYADSFKIIDTPTVSIAVARDELSMALMERLRTTGTTDYRKLQKYTCSMYIWELEELLKQGAVKEYGGVYCLDNNDYYDIELGIGLQGRDYIIDGGGMIL